jgi:polyhydroxybutyrate depolymerase
MVAVQSPGRVALAGLAAASACVLAVTAPAEMSASGCRSATASSTIAIQVGGLRRTAIVHVPLGYTGKTLLPLVLNLHGSGSTADQQRLFTAMSKTANTDGFIVAYPQAAIVQGSGFDWNVPGQPLVGGRPVPRGTPNDVAFLDELISSLEGSSCVDAHRVYATGFSGGARMVSGLGCELSGRLAAIAPVSGLRFPSACHATHAVPVISFHGTADPVDPYTGHGQPYWTYSVPDAASRWATRDGCDPTPAVRHPATTVTLTAYSGCRNGASVELYTIEGEGHEWPGGPTLPADLTRVLGPQSNAVDANALIWKFFAAHHL